jgi:hypothetical protein
VKKPKSKSAEKAPKPTAAPAPANQHHLPWDKFSGRKSGRVIFKPQIVANNPDLKALAAQAWKVIQDFNTPPFLFRREGRLCRIEHDDAGFPVPVSVDVPRMQFMIVELIEWIKKDDNGSVSSARPPRDLAAHLVCDPSPPVPILKRIVTAPIFTAKGQLLDLTGTCADGIIYLPPKNLRLPTIPRSPTEEQICSAVKFIKEDLLVDFPFASESEFANCVAALLTPFVREMIPGPTPLFWIDKATGGAGGTLLSWVIAAPILGCVPSAVTAPRDEAEWRRLILSTLRASPNMFSIDNCNAHLSSEALANAITGPSVRDRIMGTSNSEVADVRCLWLINGNNLRFGWELARRTVRIRIHSDIGPDQRDTRDFVHPELLSWILRNRGKVLYHLLVLINGWQAGGAKGPAEGIPQFPSFEAWRRVIGGILHSVGIPGFLLNLPDAQEEADVESSTLRAFLEAWAAKRGLSPVFTSDLLMIARQLYRFQTDDHAAAIQLGKVLSKHENQTHNGLRIERLPLSEGKTRWQLQKVKQK